MEQVTREIRRNDSAITIEYRADGNPSRVVTGYALKFEKESKPICGFFVETIRRGALDGADISDVIAKFNHNYNSILGRTKSGTLTLTVDDIGLRFSFEAPNTTEGNDMLELIRRGDLSECSFAMTVESEEWEFAEDRNRLDRRTITAIRKIYDISIVIDPAYSDTEVVAARSLHLAAAENKPKTEVPEGRDGEIEFCNQLLEMELTIAKNKTKNCLIK